MKASEWNTILKVISAIVAGLLGLFGAQEAAAAENE